MKVRQFAVSALALFATFAVWAETETVGGITWTYTIKDDSTAEVANGSHSAIPTSTTGVIVIPSTLGDKPVTSIGDSAFFDCSGLTSVTIPSSVTSIGKLAFAGCTSLATLYVDSVESWCKISFAGLGSNPFYSSSEEKTLVVGGQPTTVLVIPAGVTSIPAHAFYNWSMITSVTIPESVTSIGEYAFDGCSGLTSVTIPSSVTSIGNFAFTRCHAITSATVPGWSCGILFPTGADVVISEGVTSIGEMAFFGCSGLASVTIPSSVTSIGEMAFFDCSGLTSVTISEGVTSIGASAFSGCSGLTSVTIPSGVTSIGGNAFTYCSGLESVTISEGVTSIGEKAFSGCNGLTSVTIPSSVTSIGDYAFNGCKMLESVTVLATDQPEGGLKMFEGCYGGLFAIFVPQDSVENYRGADGWNAYVKNIRVMGEERPGSKDNPWEIGLMDAADVKAWTSGTKLVIEGASAMCDFTSLNKAPWYGLGSLLTKVVIEEGVASIGGFAFQGCRGLMSVTIPSSVTSIGQNAFQGCSGLASVTIPSSVTSIGQMAFFGCSGLTSVTIPSSVTSIGASAFSDCSGLTSVMIPSSVTSIGASAFGGCSGLTSVMIPSSVTSIGASAFYNCSKLGSVLVMASDPPTCESRAFDRVAAGFVIRVPSESVGKYNTVDGWKTYERSIQGACVAGDAVLAWMDGTAFVVEGTGAMYDFASAEDVPWAEAVGLATAVTIADTVTHIGGNALTGLKDAATVNGTPVANIRPYAQGFCSAGTVIPDDKVLVAKEEIQAAKAEAVTVTDGVVTLGVTVNTNGDFTAETKDWAPVELKDENVEVKDGKIVITIPVGGDSGFMILQSGDAKVPNAAVTHEPWYTPIE